jgi:DNA ligase-1
MANREFLMLAQVYDPTKHYIGSWFVSEKLDGMRAWWDGGITVGIPKSNVPWANCDKDSRLVNPEIATGLWSRYGNVIHAPEHWTKSLPKYPLDGEIHIDRTIPRQQLGSIIRRLNPDSIDWESVRLKVFDSPTFTQVFQAGRINNPNFKKIMDRMMVIEEDHHPPFESFEDTYLRLNVQLEADSNAQLVTQTKLPFSDADAVVEVYKILDALTNRGAEGVMIRNPRSFWNPTRSVNLLKLKSLSDAEGTVIGYMTGQGKLQGLLGALILDYNGQRLELSGFTDDERIMSDYVWAYHHPGYECPDTIYAIHFPRGSKVTFKYQGVSVDGIPQTARYWRKYQET